MLPVVTNTGYKKRLDTGENKQNGNTCTAVPVPRERYVLTSCRIPPRITCNDLTPGTYPWYIRGGEEFEG